LRWHGGYPINNLNPKYDTILKLVEREFLSMFPNQLTPEKEFCAKDIKTDKKMKEMEAHLNAELKRQLSFTESKYIDHVSIDFEDLPKYIVQRGIIWRFEGERLHNDADYLKWRDQLLEFLQTVPKIYIIKTLQKGIEYSRKVYTYHLYNECTNPDGCSLNQSWERRIAMAEEILNDLLEKESPKQTTQSTSESKEYDFSKYNIPVIQLSNPERLWMEDVYKRMKIGIRFSFKEIRSKLNSQLPINFRPSAIDSQLISSNGEEIRLLGVIALQKEFIILEKINKTISAIRDIILKDYEKRNIEIIEIVEKCALSVEEVNICLRLVRDYGTFYSGSSYITDSTILKSIDIGGSDAIYYEYIQFLGIEQLIILKSYQYYGQPGEEFTVDEMMEMSRKLDSLFQELQTLKLGQEIIWTDVLNELNELKAHYSLNKKNWKQLFAGKIVDMVTSGVISETVSKKLVEFINPFVGKLLG
jgi:hypothetical protein